MKNLERREFLQLLVQTLAASSVVLAVPLAACGETSKQSDSAGDRLLPDLDAAIALGQRYLKKHPDRGPLQKLTREVFGDGAMSNEARTRMVAERIQNDFIAGDVIEIKGWRLARTEAVLCALIAREGTVPSHAGAG